MKSHFCFACGGPFAWPCPHHPSRTMVRAPMPVVTPEEHAAAVRFDAEMVEVAALAALPWCRSCGGVP